MKKSPFLSGALVVMAFAMSAFSIGQPVPPTTAAKLTPEVKAKVLKGMEQVITRVAFVPGADFSKWPVMLAKHQDKLDKAADENQFVEVINSALEEFGFSHTLLFPPSFGQQRTTGTRAGIGIRLEIEKNGVRITDLFPYSPATKAGLQVGDLIFECDGKAVKGVAELAGVKGQTSLLKYERAGQKRQVSITRDDYKAVIPETLTWNGDTAIFKLPTFDQGYSIENVDRLLGEASKAKNLILDLRSNGGGAVTNLMHFMSYFLDRESQPMGTFIGRYAFDQYRKANPNEPMDLAKIAESTGMKVRALRSKSGLYKGNIAVLISGSTGSASEMAAASLKDYRGATLIGSQSAGAVLASTFMPLQDGAGFWAQIPLTDYVTIKGVRLEGVGVRPDYMAEIPRFGEADKAVAKAMDVFQNAALKGAFTLL